MGSNEASEPRTSPPPRIEVDPTKLWLRREKGSYRLLMYGRRLVARTQVRDDGSLVIGLIDYAALGIPVSIFYSTTFPDLDHLREFVVEELKDPEIRGDAVVWVVGRDPKPPAVPVELLPTSGNPPQWARRLLARVCADEGIEPPHLTWRRSSKAHSTGYCAHSRNVIHITAGTDRPTLRLVLLHELAHQLVRAGHTAKFWDTAWRLYRRYGVKLSLALRVESAYKVGALRAAVRAGIPGAAARLEQFNERR